MAVDAALPDEYSAPIAGAVETLAWLRQSGIKIGSCSGYPREVLDVVLESAIPAGISPDCSIAGDELPAGGHPGPYMALANVLALAIGDVRHCVKIDDTVPGIEEGRRAGMWCVGVTVSGNEVGYSLAEFKRATSQEIDQRKAWAGAALARGRRALCDRFGGRPARGHPQHQHAFANWRNPLSLAALGVC